MDNRSLPVEQKREVFGHLASGLSPYAVARVTGVSKTTVYRWHHEAGGMYRPAGTTYSNRYLDLDERLELARLLEAGWSLRKIAERLGRSPSTVSRELDRNRDPKTGHYLPARADRQAWQRQRRPKPSKLSCNPPLQEAVQGMLDKRYSPEQVAGRLKVEHPDDPTMWISTESIYRGIYIYPRGELKRELKACLRTGRTIRKRRGRREIRGGIPDAVPIRDRPEEVKGRLVPGHWEGDLIKGSLASNSAIATLVERTTGFAALLALPNGYAAEHVTTALVDYLATLPDRLAKTLTWDRGRELARHAQVTRQSGIQVYFADPYSPWQRGSNENINGLFREYLPKGTDLSIHTPAQLQAIADELNDRPRKRHGFLTPNEVLARLLDQDLESVATTP